MPALPYRPRCTDCLEGIAFSRGLLADVAARPLPEWWRRSLVSTLLWVQTEGPTASTRGPGRIHKLYEVPFRTPEAQAEGGGEQDHVVRLAPAIDRVLADPVHCLAVAEELVACIVTTEQHKKLNSTPGNGWDRYSDARIAVLDARRLPGEPEYGKVPPQ